jgi:hypothetical protein
LINTGEVLEENPLRLAIEGPTVVTPRFIEQFFTLTLATNASGGAKALPIAANNKYRSGTTVTLAPDPRLGFVFSNWIVDEINPVQQNPLTLVMDRDRTVKINYTGAPLEITRTETGALIVIGDAEFWMLQSSPDLITWTEVTTGTTGRQIRQIAGETQKYFRLIQGISAPSGAQ